MSDFTALCDICGASQSVPSYGDWRCVQCDQSYEYDEGYRISLTDAQRALLRHPPRWIPVAERLPEERQKVLAYSYRLHGGSEPGSVCVFDNGTFHGIDWLGTVTATHWMPLPAPPEATP